VSCLVYLILPFTVLTLYPSLSRLDAALVEAARTMGASALRAFATVVVPMVRGPLLASFLMAAVLAIGSYVAPIVLGRPQDWTLAILITRTALGGQDMPGSAAIAMLLLAATLALALVTAWLGRGVRR
jgi:putative spermidine/putrescine transport system permease protein